MSDISPRPERNIKYYLGAWLIFIILLSTVFLTFCLSAFQVRLRFQNVTIANQSMSFFGLEDLAGKWIKAEESRQPLEIRLADIDQQNAKLASEERRLSHLIRQGERQVIDRINASLPAGSNFDIDPSDTDFSQRYDTILARIAVARKTDKTFMLAEADQKLISELDDKVSAYDDLVSQANGLTQQMSSLVATAKENGPNQTVQAAFFTTENPDPVVVRRVKEVLVEVRSLGVLGNLLWIPQELLTLLIVTSAGALGRSVQLLRRMQVGDASTQNRLTMTLDPFFGSVLGLILFIVLKAGVLIVVDPRTLSQSGPELNPFFIAFIGIIGGLLSEQIIDRVSAFGQRWLNTASHNDMWAIGVQEVIAAKGKNVQDLAGQLRLPRTTIEQWVSGSVPVPLEGQFAISAWLGLPIAQLFEPEAIGGSPSGTESPQG